MIIPRALKRIECEVSILGWDGRPYREWRRAVPSTGGEVAYEVPMGVVEVGRSEIRGTGGPAYGNVNYDEPCSEIRPREVRDFMSVGDGRSGMTLSSSVAVMDFKDPTTDPAQAPILQAVLLASRRSCHGEGNWYLQEGDHHYRFSLTSHEGGWRNGSRSAMGFNAALLPVVGVRPAAGASLPEEMSFFSGTAPNVLISTVKKADDDDSVVIRCYELEGRDSVTRLKTFVPTPKAERVNIIEEEGRPTAIGRDGLELKVGHNAIETVKLWPAAKGKS